MTHDLPTTTRQILDVFFTFISIVIYSSSFTFNWQTILIYACLFTLTFSFYYLLYELDKIVKNMRNVETRILESLTSLAETTTKFSRLKSISSMSR